MNGGKKINEESGCMMSDAGQKDRRGRDILYKMTTWEDEMKKRKEDKEMEEKGVW